MTFDGLLGLFALIAGVFALMPSDRRWLITLRGPLVVAASLAALGLTLYLEYFTVLARPCPAAFDRACPWLVLAPAGQESAGRLSAPQAAFAVVAAWLALATYVIARQRIGAGAIRRLARLVVEKTAEERYADVVQLVAANIGLLDRAATGRLALPSLRSWLAQQDPWRGEAMIARVKASVAHPPRTGRGAFKPWAMWLLSRLRFLVPGASQAEEAAQDVLRTLFTTPQLVRYIALSRPYVGLALLKVRTTTKFEFSKAFLRLMIEEPLSLLYRELPLNQNISAGSGYWIPRHNQLLHALFADARLANELQAVDDISAYIQERLQDQAYRTGLNQAGRWFSEDGKWRDPTFAALRVFDIQAQAFANQGVEWHGSAYEMPKILKGLIAGYNADGVDPHFEWPTRADYLIYVLFGALSAWAEQVLGLKADNLHRQLESPAAVDQNNSVPKSAMLALGQALDDLLEAPAVPERFKDYIFEIILRSIAGFPRDGDLGRFRAAYINAIVAGGLVMGDRAPEKRLRLARYYRAQDPLLRERAEDFGRAVDAEL